MQGEFGVGGAIKRAHRDGNRIVMDRIPKQEAAAGFAKSPSDFF